MTRDIVGFQPAPGRQTLGSSAAVVKAGMARGAGNRKPRLVWLGCRLRRPSGVVRESSWDDRPCSGAPETADSAMRQEDKRKAHKETGPAQKLVVDARGPLRVMAAQEAGGRYPKHVDQNRGRYRGYHQQAAQPQLLFKEIAVDQAKEEQRDQRPQPVG